jgi:hypothetical protein
MNNSIFVNHVALAFLDRSIMRHSEYTNYFGLHNRFPFPPGVEYVVSRNMPYEIHNPWGCKTTQYPMPALPTTPITFAEAADSFGASISDEIELGKDVYLLWSGGIDSTSVAVSVLKNLKPHQREKLIVVCSEVSRRENPMFYHNFLKDFKQLDFFEFNPANIDLKNSLILDGEGGDQTFGSSAANKMFSMDPDKINQPWRNNIDFMKATWLMPDETQDTWDFFMNMMQTTIAQGSAEVETLYDFFWWLNFNFKIDSVMFRTSLALGELVADEDFEYYVKHSLRRMFVSDKMQQWSMTAGSAGKIGNARKTVKFGARQYIYEFDKNEYYYREKRKEFSLVNLDYKAGKYFAIDKNYKRYTFEDRAVRQKLRELFYSDRTGKIKFFMKPNGLNKIYDLWGAVDK